MKYCIDRIEGETAVLEDENARTLCVKKTELPADVKEGSVVEFDGKAYYHDSEEEKLRKKRLFEKQWALKRKNRE